MITSYRKLAYLAGVSLLLGAGPAQAGTLTFDELLAQPVDGLTFAGVTFGFTVGGVSSDDATYNSAGPGLLTYVQDPVLEGDANGILSIAFEHPEHEFSFGLALNSFDDLAPGAAVSLFDVNDVLLGIVDLATSPLVGASEGWFSYLDPANPVSRFELDFDETAADRFALDNLSASVVPEAGTWFAGASVMTLGLRQWRRRKA